MQWFFIAGILIKNTVKFQLFYLYKIKELQCKYQLQGRLSHLKIALHDNDFKPLFFGNCKVQK